MKIHLHIERLTLDGISLSPRHRPLLQTTVEAELTRLLASGGLSNSLQSDGALPSVEAAGIQMGKEGDPARLGAQIAEAVYGGIGR